MVKHERVCQKVNGDWYCVPITLFVKEGFRLKHAKKNEEYKDVKSKSVT